MFIVEWLFDKMGYTKKVDITTLIGGCQATVTFPPNDSKITVKRKPAVKKSARKTVRKKNG